MGFYLSTVLTPVLLLVIEYYFSNVTVLVLMYKFSVLFPPLFNILNQFVKQITLSAKP